MNQLPEQVARDEDAKSGGIMPLGTKAASLSMPKIRSAEHNQSDRRARAGFWN